MTDLEYTTEDAFDEIDYLNELSHKAWEKEAKAYMAVEYGEENKEVNREPYS